MGKGKGRKGRKVYKVAWRRPSKTEKAITGVMPEDELEDLTLEEDEEDSKENR